MYAKYPKRQRTRFSERVELVEEDCLEDTDEDVVVYKEQLDIVYHADVTSASIKSLYGALNTVNLHIDKNWSSMHEDPWICVRINSAGGEFYPAMSAMEFIRRNRYNVYCIMEGHVCSAAIFIAIGCAYRVSYPSTVYLIHSVRHNGTDDVVTYKDIKEEAHNVDLLCTVMKSALKRYSNINDKEFEECMMSENMFGADRALELGLCNEISFADSE